MKSGRIERIGHRGAPRDILENTLASFQRALTLGADAIELDVHCTADGVVVVHHDAELGKCEPRSVRGGALAQLTWDALREVRLGGAHPIPRLDEVLALIRDRAKVYVEIKGAGIEQAVVDVIRGSNATCAVHSFDHAAIERVASLAPEFRRGVLFDDHLRDLESVMQRTGATDVWPKRGLIDQALVDRVHAAGGRVIAWTVNSRPELARLGAIGVDGICTDDLGIFQDGPAF